MPLLADPPSVVFWQDLLTGFSGWCFVCAVSAAIPKTAGLFDSWRRARIAPVPSKSESAQNGGFKAEVRPNLAHFAQKEIKPATKSIWSPRPFKSLKRIDLIVDTFPAILPEASDRIALFSSELFDRSRRLPLWRNLVYKSG